MLTHCVPQFLHTTRDFINVCWMTESLPFCREGQSMLEQSYVICFLCLKLKPHNRYCHDLWTEHFFPRSPNSILDLSPTLSGHLYLPDQSLPGLCLLTFRKLKTSCSFSPFTSPFSKSWKLGTKPPPGRTYLQWTRVFLKGSKLRKGWIIMATTT